MPGAITLDDLQELIRRVESVRREEDQLTGERAALLKQVRSDLGVGTPRQLRRLCVKLTKLRRKKTAGYAARYKRFRAAYDAYLEARRRLEAKND